MQTHGFSPSAAGLSNVGHGLENRASVTLKAKSVKAQAGCTAARAEVVPK